MKFLINNRLLDGFYSGSTNQFLCQLSDYLKTNTKDIDFNILTNLKNDRSNFQLWLSNVKSKVHCRISKTLRKDIVTLEIYKLVIENNIMPVQKCIKTFVYNYNSFDFENFLNKLKEFFFVKNEYYHKTNVKQQVFSIPTGNNLYGGKIQQISTEDIVYTDQNNEDYRYVKVLLTSCNILTFSQKINKPLPFNKELKINYYVVAKNSEEYSVMTESEFMDHFEWM